MISSLRPYVLLYMIAVVYKRTFGVLLFCTSFPKAALPLLVPSQLLVKAQGKV